MESLYGSVAGMDVLSSVVSDILEKVAGACCRPKRRASRIPSSWRVEETADCMPTGHNWPTRSVAGLLQHNESYCSSTCSRSIRSNGRSPIWTRFWPRL